MTDGPPTSEHTPFDWAAFAARLAPVEVIDEQILVRKRSRDFFWYSPILNEHLKGCFADLVARPRDVTELAQCLAEAFADDVPLVVRGGGTGNYGQAVPLDGGMIIETTAMNRVLAVRPGEVQVEAGALMADINAELAASGQELVMFPSTQDIATIGGFVAGGSGGIGSVTHGMLRDPGNLIALTAMSVEAKPTLHSFYGAEALHIHHAWGMNGVITDVTVRAVPRRDWIGCIAAFDDYAAAYAAGYALACASDLGCKLVSIVDARIAAYFPRLAAHVPEGRHLLVTLVPAEGLPACRAEVARQGGQMAIAMTDAERREQGLPHVFEFSYNHTTLQVLKSDRRATYQQIGVPDAADVARVDAMRQVLGADVWAHHEFARVGGRVVAFELPIVWFTSAARLAEIDATYSAAGFAVYDAHTFRIEGAGLRNVDYRHLAWKKRMDPKGLLNSGKSQVWDRVRHLSPDEIEQLGRSPS